MIIEEYDIVQVKKNGTTHNGTIVSLHGQEAFEVEFEYAIDGSRVHTIKRKDIIHCTDGRR